MTYPIAILINLALFVACYFTIRIYKKYKLQQITEIDKAIPELPPEKKKKFKRMGQFTAFPSRSMMVKESTGHKVKRAPGKPKPFAGRKYQVKKNPDVNTGGYYIHGNHICKVRGFLKSGQVAMECGKASMPKNLKVQELVC